VSEVRLPDDQLERLADLVVERLRGAGLASPRPRSFVDAHAVAAAIGMSVDFVREHADELGVVRQGVGVRPRLRFDLERALSAWDARQAGERSDAAEVPTAAGAPRRRRRPASGTGVELLPIRGPQGVRDAA
jgi:ABC-type amino acid transport substrate-binding protein